jgi:protein-tyrosine phosphatase
MIDLHCHILPGIDDGAPNMETSLKMARIAEADGIDTIACTPHIFPGVFENNGPGIKGYVEKLQQRFDEEGIRIKLSWGADAHVAPNLAARLKDGSVPSLNDGRYFLLEPPHNVAPPNFEEYVFNILASGYVPVVTHPERLTWIEDHYEVFGNLVKSGAWMQITSGSLCGRFGGAAKYWGERMLDEGLVHILATDAHSPDRRPPLLAEGQRAAEKWVGAEEARHLVETRPRGIMDNVPPDTLPALPSANPLSQGKKSWFARLFG